jgi:hypothetical protein
MRKFIRRFVFLSMVGTIVGLIVKQQQATRMTPPYPDPWTAPVAPPFPTGESVEEMGSNGLAAPVVDAESLG